MDTDFALTPIETTLRDLGRHPHEKWCVTPVAGLQFYDYDEGHDLSGLPIRPERGDRLELVRRPDNKADGNAIEIRFRNGQYLLGHLPRTIAAKLAPAMDEGEPVHAFALNGGNGERWSVDIILIGDAVPEGHWRLATTEKAEHEAREIEKLIESIDLPRQSEPSSSPIADEQVEQKRRRLNDAVSALWPLLPELPVPVEAMDTPNACPGHVFSGWKEVPGSLRTKNGWTELGRSVPAKAAPFATVQYRSYHKAKIAKLYAFDQTAPKRAPRLVGGDEPAF